MGIDMFIKHRYLKRLVLLLTVCVFINANLLAQLKTKEDSLLAQIKVEKHDTAKIFLYTKLKNYYVKIDKADKALLAANQSLALSRGIKNEYYRLLSLNQKGYCFERMGERDSALHMFDLVSQTAPTKQNYTEVTSALNHIGNFYYDKGDLNNCLTYYQKNLKLSLQFVDSSRILSGYANLGNIYIELKRPKIALEKCRMALHYLSSESTELNKCQLLYATANAYIDCAKTFNEPLYTDSAKVFLNQSVVLARKNNNLIMQCYNYSAFGNIFFDKTLYDSAIVYYSKSFELSKQNGMEFMPVELLNLSSAYLNKRNYKKAKELGLETLTYADELGYRDFADLYDILAISEDKLNNPASAYKYMKLAKLYSDSVFGESASEKRKELEMNFEFEKKQEQQKIEQEKKDILVSEEMKQQRQQRNYVMLGLIIVAVFTTFIFRGLKKQRAANKIISMQKQQVEQKNHIIEEKQKEILDSIHYAKRIQSALLANKELIDSHIPGNFIVFKPKDIVSGDFYWATEQNGKFYLAVCDSTGHGVPGAFMSLLNMGFLSEAIKEKKIVQSNKVFDYVRTRLVNTIGNDGQKDGMDGILICYDKTNSILEYAAANNEPVMVLNNELTELAKDKMPVGKGELDKPFTLHTMTVQPGTMLYLYTDGYADQFGGPKGKKFKYRSLNNLIVSNATLPLAEQEEKLSAGLDNWKGDLEQVDDVCVIGIRF